MLISNATISSGKDNETKVVDIVVDGGRIIDIVDVQPGTPAKPGAVDASGFLVLPGAIDPHVHFDTPGYTDHEDFEHGSMAAAAGGVTCVIDMPDTSIPPVVGRSKLRSKLSVIEGMSVIDYAMWGGVSGNIFRGEDWKRKMENLMKAGVVGFKSYLLSGRRSFEHLFPIELVEVMRHAKHIGALVGLHAEDRDLAQKQMAMLQTQGRFDAKAYYEARRDPVESEGIKQGIAIASATGCPLHIVHVGSADGAKDAVRHRKDGCDITLETCPHYLAFTGEDLIARGAIVKTSPVVKTKEDLQKLWEYLASGGVDFLASDHAPCTEKEKHTGSIWTDYAGMPGTELLFSFAFSEGYKKGRLTLARLTEVTSTAAAKRFGLYPRKGAISKGSDADLVFVDENRKWRFAASDLHSKGKLTPFDGHEFHGKVVRTMLRGKVVFDEAKGFLVEPGFGQFIRREV